MRAPRQRARGKRARLGLVGGLAEEPRRRGRPRCRRRARARPSPRPPRAPCAARSRPRPRAARRPRSSSTSAGRTSNGMPSCSRIARRCGRAGCERSRALGASSGNQSPISRSADSSESEPWTRLKVDLEREVAADRAGRGLDRVGRADHLARGRDRSRALEHHRDQRAAGDELDQLAEERLARRARRSAARRARASTLHQLQRDDAAGPCARSGR